MAQSKVQQALYEAAVSGKLPNSRGVRPNQLGFVQAPQFRNTQGDGGAEQLVKSLSSFSNTFADSMGTISKINTTETQDQAQKDYLKLSTEQRKAMINSGELTQQDGVYQAMFNRLYGEDMARQQQSDTIAKLQTGELRFKDNNELETYLQKQRETDLQNSGGNEYLASGYDTHFADTRNQAMQMNSVLRSKEYHDQTVHQIQSQFIGVAKETNGDPAALQKTYQTLQTAFHFDDAAMHQTLSEAAQTLAKEGNTDGVKRLLGTTYSQNKEYGTLGDYLGGDAETLLKNAEAVNLDNKSKAFKNTHLEMIQAASEGRLAQFLGAKRADASTLSQYLESKGVLDTFSAEAMGSLLNRNQSTIEENQRKAEVRLMKAQQQQFNEQLSQLAYNQFTQYGAGAVRDVLITKPDGTQQVFTASSLVQKASLEFNQNLDAQVQQGKIKPEEAFTKKLEVYGRGGNNPEWQQQLNNGVQAANMLVTNPNDENTKKVLNSTLDLYARLKVGGNGLADRHVSGENRAVLEAALVARQHGLDPAQVMYNYNANPDPIQSISLKDLQLKGIPETRMQEAANYSKILIRGMNMNKNDALNETKKFIKDQALDVNGDSVYPIHLSMPIDKQQEFTANIIKQRLEANPTLGVDPSQVTLQTPNTASGGVFDGAGYYLVQLKGSHTTLRDDKGRPMVITVKDLDAEEKRIHDELVKSNMDKALGHHEAPKRVKSLAEFYQTYTPEPVNNSYRPLLNK